MHLKEIWIFPVKGLRGIPLSEAELTPQGLRGDRRFMLVGTDGNFISQRSHPQLATLSTSIADDGVVTVTSGDDIGGVILSPDMVTTEQVRTTMWEHQFSVHLLPAEVNRQMSALVGSEVKVAYKTDADVRTKIYDVGDTAVSLADGYPYLVAGTASLDLLNTKLTKPVPMDRFRANLIIESTEPHIEDTLGEFAIGDKSMYVVKPCARCQVITIDQATGVKGQEPTRTLAKYRRDGNKINFGANAVAKSLGSIAVGDLVQKL